MSFESFPSDWKRAKDAEQEVRKWRNMYFTLKRELTQLQKELNELKKRKDDNCA